MRRTLVLVALASLSACPHPAEEAIRKGNVYFASKDYARAAELYEQAAEADAKSARAREGRGNCAYELGDYALAAKWYRRAIEAHPQGATARHQLALSLAALDDVAGAIEALEATLAVAPHNPYAHSLLGGLYKRSGKLDRAEKHQLEALQIDEDYHAARYALGNLLADAERQFARLAAKKQDGLAAYGLARLAAKSGRPDEAARHLERLLDGPLAEPRRILEDPVFAPHWGAPALAPLHARLAAKTSTAP